MSPATATSFRTSAFSISENSLSFIFSSTRDSNSSISVSAATMFPFRDDIFPVDGRRRPWLKCFIFAAFSGAVALIAAKSTLKYASCSFAVITMDSARSGYFLNLRSVSPSSLASYVGSPCELMNTLVCSPYFSPGKTIAPSLSSKIPFFRNSLTILIPSSATSLSKKNSSNLVPSFL